MNLQAIRILFLKDLFLSRRFLFAYFVAGMISSAITCVPHSSVSFIGFILMLTVAIASGIHFIGNLLLSESTDNTRLFVLSLPISLLDYSLGKIAVILTTYLIPWTSMLICAGIGTVISPWGHQGSIISLPVIFLYLLSGFMVQLVTAVISESVGWTICVMVGCNVGLNVFLMQFFAIPSVSEIVKGDQITWPPVVLQIISVELAIIILALSATFFFQTKKRDLI